MYLARSDVSSAINDEITENHTKHRVSGHEVTGGEAYKIHLILYGTIT
jgi:hypothetical protein